MQENYLTVGDDIMDKQEQRIFKILGENNDITNENAEKYRQYLMQTLMFPCVVTGIEDFQWEEPYVLGGWDPKEYLELKKTNPSYTDHYDLLELLPPENDDIVARVRRISDKREFQIDLSWLKCKEKKHISFQLLDDYACWRVNF